MDLNSLITKDKLKYVEQDVVNL